MSENGTLDGSHAESHLGLKALDQGRGHEHKAAQMTRHPFAEGALVFLPCLSSCGRNNPDGRNNGAQIASNHLRFLPSWLGRNNPVAINGARKICPCQRKTLVHISCFQDYSFSRIACGCGSQVGKNGPWGKRSQIASWDQGSGTGGQLFPKCFKSN